MDLCERCKRAEAAIHLAGELESEALCQGCFNKMISYDLGVELEEHPHSISVVDVQGIMRHFDIEKRILPNGIFLEAKEDIMYGYAFAVHGELDCD